MRVLPFLAAVSSSLVACGGGGSSPSAPAVVVVQDGSLSDAREIVSPAVLALQHGLEGSGVDLRIVEGDGAAEVTGAVAAAAADPTAVAVVFAPFTDVPADAVRAASDAGLSALSLSSLGEAPAGPGAPWRRLVAPLDAEAIAIAGLLGDGADPCVAGEGSEASRTLTDAVARDAGARVLPGDPEAVAAAVGGCDALAWTGSAEGALTIAPSLRDAGVPLVVGSEARTEAVAASVATVGALGACGCADLTTSVDPAAQAFLHDYQLATGLDPGPFAVEGADAASLLLHARVAAGRDAVRAGLADLTRVIGLGGTYVWDSDGDLRSPGVRIYRVTGVRWLPAASPTPGVARLGAAA